MRSNRIPRRKNQPLCIGGRVSEFAQARFLSESLWQTGSVLDCECERSSDLSLRQSLLLVNDGDVRAQCGILRAMWPRPRKLSRLSRPYPIRHGHSTLVSNRIVRLPSENELERMRAHLNSSQNSSDALEDMVWAILNSKEFLFVR